MTRGKSDSTVPYRVGLSERYAAFEDKKDADHQNLTSTVSVSAQVTPGISLSISFPYHQFESESGGVGGDSSESGPGDMVLFGTWAPWSQEVPDEEEFFDKQRFSFLFGLRLPTGDDDLDQFAGVGGEIVPLGSGTTDIMLGGAYGVTLEEPFRIFDTLLLTIPLKENDDEPPAGTFLGTKSAFSILNRLGGAWAASESIDVQLAIDFLYKAGASGTAVSKDDGGTFAWIAPGVVFDTSEETAIEISAQIPLKDGFPSVTAGFSVHF